MCYWAFTLKIPILHFDVCSSLLSDMIFAESEETVDLSPMNSTQKLCIDAEIYSLNS